MKHQRLKSIISKKIVLWICALLLIVPLCQEQTARAFVYSTNSSTAFYDYNGTALHAFTMSYLGLNSSDDIDALSLGDDPTVFGDPRYDVFAVTADSTGANTTGTSTPVEYNLYIENHAGGNRVLMDNIFAISGNKANEGQIDGFDFSDVDCNSEGSWIYFSLTATSPTLASNSSWSAADVFACKSCNCSNTLFRFAEASQIGLNATADIDGLSIYDHVKDGGTFNATSDYIIYTLHDPTSTTVFHYGLGAPSSHVAHDLYTFGLQPGDSITALEHKVLGPGGASAWAKAYGGSSQDYATSIQQTRDGGYIVAGVMTQSYQQYPWIIRLDAMGNIQWQKIYVQKDISGSQANCIRQTTDGGYIVVGMAVISSTSPPVAPVNAWVMKLNSTGDVMWHKVYGGNLGGDGASSVWQTSDGGYVVAGSTSSFTAFGKGGPDAWIFKLDPDGNIQWQKVYGRVYSYELISVPCEDSGAKTCFKEIFGLSTDWANSIQQTNDGGYIVAGSTQAWGNATQDFWILRLDSTGNILWNRLFGRHTDPSLDNMDEAHTIHQTADGGYIVAGITYSFGAGGSDFWVLKLDSNGDIIWQKAYGGPKDDGPSGDDGQFAMGFNVAGEVIRQTDDGGYIIVGRNGEYGGGGWLLKLDQIGNIQWQKLYASVYAQSVQQTADKGYVIAGSNSPDEGDVLVLKMDQNGLVPGFGDILYCPYIFIDDTNATEMDTNATVGGITSEFNSVNGITNPLEGDSSAVPRDVVVVAQNTSVSANSLCPTGVIPGDCNGDGQVSIAEVQKAINCFLGIQNTCCDKCDLNEDGQVTIDELQKVINTFLGK